MKKKKASILRHSTFYIVQLSHPYMTTGKTIALTRRTFADKVMSLLFNMLSRLSSFSSKELLLISWLQSPSAVILEPPKIVSHCFKYVFNSCKSTEYLELLLFANELYIFNLGEESRVGKVCALK